MYDGMYDDRFPTCNVIRVTFAGAFGIAGIFSSASSP
jgi:hypothetical protein